MLTPPLSAAELTAETIKAILRRENELRLAPQTQARFKAISHRPDGWLDVVESLQRQVAAEFGLSEKVGLDAMRCAETLLPGDTEVRDISLYRKYNRCVDGPLRMGDAPPDANLVQVSGVHGPDDMCGKRTTLHSILRDRRSWSSVLGPRAADTASAMQPLRPLVLLAGSYT